MSAVKRQDERFSTEYSVTVTSAEDVVPRQGTCLNLSTGGLFVQMPEPYPRGARVNLVIQLESAEDTISARGTVVWTRPRMPDPQFPPGMGVKFTSMANEARELLEQALGGKDLRRRDPEGESTSPGSDPA